MHTSKPEEKKRFLYSLLGYASPADKLFAEYKATKKQEVGKKMHSSKFVRKADYEGQKSYKEEDK